MPKSLKYHEFLSRLRDFGVIEIPRRGKGSERYLVRPAVPGETKGPFCTVKCHGSGDTVAFGTIAACLRRLQIDAKDFWKYFLQ